MRTGDSTEVSAAGALVDRAEAMAALIARWANRNGRTETRVPGLTLFRSDAPTEAVAGLYEPSVCYIAQGAKEVLLGEEHLRYDPETYLITSVHLPTLVRITAASPAEPYLALRLTFDLREVSRLLVDGRLPGPSQNSSGRGMAVGAMTPTLLNAFLRLLNLQAEAADIPVLAPLIQREILYRILTGEQGHRLCDIASNGSKGFQISRTIEWLREHFAEPLRVEDLAREAGMSATTFHSHFRSMTSLSPLQFQKSLRLQEARRLMLAENLDAATAAFNVGYESPSQFSREYGRLFGAPPKRDISKLRERVAS